MAAPFSGRLPPEKFCTQKKQYSCAFENSKSLVLCGRFGTRISSNDQISTFAPLLVSLLKL